MQRPDPVYNFGGDDGHPNPGGDNNWYGNQQATTEASSLSQGLYTDEAFLYGGSQSDRDGDAVSDGSRLLMGAGLQ